MQQALDAEKERDLARNDAALQDAVLAREVETDPQLYEDVLRRMQEMAVAEQGPVSNVNIVTGAFAPRRPSEPKVFKCLTIAGLLGLIAGLTLTFVLEHNDHRFKDVEEIERYLHVPRLAVAPDYIKLKQRVPRSPRTAAPGPSARNPVMSIERLYSSNYIEPYRMIGVALLFARGGNSPKAILFTSAIPEEGKTLTVCNTALMSARMGTRTLLVDADLRHPQCHRLFPGSDTAGLKEVLEGQSGIAQATVSSRVANLSLLYAGSAAPNPPALLVSSHMRDLLDTLGTRYDSVMVDSAPVMSASDTAALATMVDGVVLVVGVIRPRKQSWNHTPG